MSVGCGGYGFARRFIQSQMPARAILTRTGLIVFALKVKMIFNQYSKSR